MRTWRDWLLAALCILAFTAPARSEWHEARTAHFIVYADQRPDELRGFAERLERFDKAVRMVRRMKDPPLTDSNRLTIFVVKGLGAIERLAGGSGVAGFYVAKASGSAAFVPARAGSTRDKWDLDAQAVFFHEYAHHLQLQYADAALPGWVSEGFAEFFARTQLREDGSVVIGVPPAYRAATLLEYRGDLSLREMLGGKTNLNDVEFDLLYGQGWLLTHYLSFAPARRGQFDRYLAEIQKGVKPLDAANAAFGDLNVLTAEIRDYIDRKTLPHLLLSSAQVRSGPLELRRLTSGEAAMIDVQMRSTIGATRTKASVIATDARRVAARFPNDPAVQTALARAELDAEDYRAADAAADRALAADPNRLKALIYKGRARMELASAAKDSNWSEVRRWFLRANEIDPEAAEPLTLFYQTFVRSGGSVTKNAVDGLLYAVALAPQDTTVRVLAVRQLIVDRRFDEARRYFAAIAFEPHFNREWRHASSKAMAAIESRESATALTHLGEIEKLLDK